MQAVVASCIRGNENSVNRVLIKRATFKKEKGLLNSKRPSKL
jgi:hypothetical protein